MEIKIECQGATTVNIDELNELHHFKDMSDQQYAEIRNSITDPEMGFSFPIFIWVDSEGKKWTVDGHQRLRALKRMRDEGYIFSALPADLIFAPNKKIAAKKIVAQESRYAKPNEGEFADFLAENELAIEDVEAFMDIPDINDSHWTATEPKEEQQEQPQLVQCPQCSTQFQVKENLV